MTFKSDAQRKHFFANNGEGSAGGAGVPGFVQPGEFSSAQMDAIENDYADYWENSGDFVRNPGFKNPMPK
ncbi:MAG: hypothetical protein Q7R66_07800 [Undibacterium sp.]|uniref:hypothetical protein n=1 Tax=Undibacterium sp. TaxID=1914977 RepID=UPI002716C5C1|nr:hypothetical protein [Undibacterium sp.]MDO8652077.1 hypothetical protein [Undibacterium sp.]